VLETLTFVTALGAAVMGGVFYAFSTGIMQALGRLPSTQGAAAMQSVNIAVINPLFLGLFLGTAALCLGLCVAAPFTWDESGSGWRLAGALLYLVGSFAVTMAANVPLNNALATVDPDSSVGETTWARYLRTWTRWNHLRTVASIAAAACLVRSLL